MPIDRAIIVEHLRNASTAAHTDAQGHAYEKLAGYVFEQVPGCRVESNVINNFRTEQVDVAVGNDRLAHGLPILPSVFLVECNDWSNPVDSKTVGYCFNILAGRGVELGVLVAANGITGQEDMLHAASLGFAAAPRGVKLIVITSKDLTNLTSTEDFIELMSRRYLRAVASGTIGLP